MSTVPVSAQGVPADAVVEALKLAAIPSGVMLTLSLTMYKVGEVMTHAAVSDAVHHSSRFAHLLAHVARALT